MHNIVEGITPCIYFSGVDSNNITVDDPSNECIIVDPELCGGVHIKKEQNARIFWIHTY